VLYAACCKYRSQKNRQKFAIWAPSHNFYQAKSLQLRHVSTIEKKLVKQQYLPTCPHIMVNFGPLMAEIGPVVWGTPANFNGFRVLAALLQQRRSTEANQTLHGVWPSPALFGGSCVITEFCQVQNSLCILQVLRSHILVALLHGT